jgi:hypothetical protein
MLSSASKKISAARISPKRFVKSIQKLRSVSKEKRSCFLNQAPTSERVQELEDGEVSDHDLHGVKTQVLMNHKLKYSPKPIYIGSTTADTGYFDNAGHRYAVTLLPHNTFRRICEPRSNKGNNGNTDYMGSVIVAHCLIHQKVGSAKQQGADEFGLYTHGALLEW